jgi:hypothetical protein
MSAQSIQPAFTTFQDIDGQPLEGGMIYIGTAGLAAATNQITVYWDSALTQAATQPIRTTGGYPMNSGTPAMIYTGSDDFSIAINDKNNSTVTSSLNRTMLDGAEMITYNGPLGTARTVNEKLQETISVEDFGAVGDGVTDDTSAVQAAITYALTRNIDVEFPGICLITASINIDRLVDSGDYQRYMKLYSNSGGGLKVSTAISMFSSTLTFTTAPVVQLVYFDGLSFIGNGGASYVLDDGRFLRTRFHGCSFQAILGCNSTIGYIQSINFTNCNIRGGVGTFWKSGGTVGFFSTDFHFENNIVEAWTGNVLSIGAPLGCTIIGNTLEGITGTAILIDGAKGISIDGNYFELNGLDIDMRGEGAAQNFSVQGLSLAGNFNGDNGGTTYMFKWPASEANIVSAISTGNHSSGYLHDLPVNATIEISDYAAGSLWSNEPKTNKTSTTWTPVDGSGAGLSFTGVAAIYRVIGKAYVNFEFELTFPATADGSNARIEGLPFDSQSATMSNPISGYVVYSDFGSPIHITGGPSDDGFALYSNSTLLTNVALSGKTIRMAGFYQS